jgi:threonine dehydrogenase-like Zn-dependent dehydrogenase
MSFAEGALVETSVVGMYAVELADLKVSDSIAILGCGPIGLVTLKAAKAAGVGRIFVTDLIEERLKFARKHSNVTAINSSRKNPVEIINQSTGGRGVDIVFEAAGAPDTYKQSIEIVRIGGEVVWIGIPEEDYISIQAHSVRRKEVVIKLVRRFKHKYQRCIQAIESGNIVVKDMVTHQFELEDITRAFNMVEKYADGVIKAIINI